MISSSREHIIGYRNNLSVFGICQSTEPIREEQVTHHGFIEFFFKSEGLEVLFC